jgi:hypothetical protein
VTLRRSRKFPLARALAAALSAALAAVAPALAFAAARAPAAPANVTTAALWRDDFEDAAAWSAHPADGVELELRSDEGVHGRALRADFRFAHGGGYAVLRRTVALDLPEDYEFRLRLRGRCRPNNLEFKLIDSTGDNVWWQNRRDVHFPADWDSIRIKRRQIQFAWGPAGGGTLRHVSAIEIAITAGEGGEGSVWFDDLALVRREPPGPWTPPVASASSSRPGTPPALVLDSLSATAWRSAPGDARPWLALDLGAVREFGGLSIGWARPRLLDYAVEQSDDGALWTTLREVRGARGRRDDLALPESEARWIRLRALAAAGDSGCAIASVTVQPLEFSATTSAFWRAVAARAPRGHYPRAMIGQPSAWTIVGIEGADGPALVNTDGAIEPRAGGFSLEPFLRVGGRLLSWSDVRTAPSLADGELPIPSVAWAAGDARLSVTVCAEGTPHAPRLLARYHVTNAGERAQRVTLAVAIRPFQVNPPVQFLGTPGGAAAVDSIRFEGRLARVNGQMVVNSLTAPSAAGGSPFLEADVIDQLAAGASPGARVVRDPEAKAAGAFVYELSLAPGASRDVVLRIGGTGDSLAARGGDPAAEWRGAYAEALSHWRSRLGAVGIALPDREVVRTLRAQLAYMLLNRHGAALQPGPRAYARSWIRDGALISDALLRLGRADVARGFLEYFAPLQFDDGRVPCCADRRGADPVPELDSNGELIYLIADLYRITGDRALGERWWPAAERACAFMDSLTAIEPPAALGDSLRAACRGILPPSISHEGYSAKAMHSYWDDAFALRGYRDAALLARALGHAPAAERLAASAARFENAFSASVRAAIRLHGIDFVPGCADLGDFDATSTALTVSPLEVDDALPPEALSRTFEKYWQFFGDRASGRTNWTAFTPYELRIAGAMARRGERERAAALLRYFLAHRQPAAWAQWPEVVLRDTTTAQFVGDLPHTWVGAEYVRSVLDMLAFERGRDHALVLGAGVPRAWLEGKGLAVRGLVTPFGALSYSMFARGDTVTVRIGAPAAPPGGFVVRAPAGTRGFRSARVNGRAAAWPSSGELVVRESPATVTLAP